MEKKREAELQALAQQVGASLPGRVHVLPAPRGRAVHGRSLSLVKGRLHVWGNHMHVEAMARPLPCVPQEAELRQQMERQAVVQRQQEEQQRRARQREESSRTLKQQLDLQAAVQRQLEEQAARVRELQERVAAEQRAREEQAALLRQQLSLQVNFRI